MRQCFVYFLLMGILVSKGSTTMGIEQYPAHFDGKHFYNEGSVRARGFFDLLRWAFDGNKKKWPTHVENTASPELPSQQNSKNVYVTFINHASFLIQINGINIITDPIYSKRAS